MEDLLIISVFTGGIQSEPIFSDWGKDDIKVVLEKGLSIVYNITDILYDFIYYISHIKLFF